jgi:hypothetical protein
MTSYNGATSLGLNDQTGRPVTAPYNRSFGGGLSPTLNDQSDRATTAPYNRSFAGAGVGLAEIPVPSLTYRMRAYDTTLARLVFWNSPMIDGAGLDYAGPGPLLDVVVSILIGS